MAEHQRIHPVQRDLEGQQEPTAPLVPPGTTKSDKALPLNDGHQPLRRTIPVMHSKPPKKRSCCCRCFCWTISLLLILILIIGIIVLALYLIFQPKIPKYSVDGIRIVQFNPGNDMSLAATINVNITARNPNEKIGIYYESGSDISAWYMDTKLCEGSLPKFYQGHENTTVLNLPMTGRTQNATSLMETLDQQQQRTGNIPLSLRANQPVRIKLGKLKLMKIKFRVRCSLVVDSLSAGSVIRTQSSSCKFRLRL